MPFEIVAIPGELSESLKACLKRVDGLQDDLFQLNTMVRTLAGTAQSPPEAILAYSRQLRGDIEVQSLLLKY